MNDPVLRRRSVRSGFRDDPVPEASIERVVAAGLSAPSSKNAQPWRLHVVTQRDLLADLAAAVQTAKDAERYVPIDPATGEPHAEWTSTVSESAEVLGAVPLAIFVENAGRFSAGRRTVARAPDAVRENALVGYGFEMVGLGAAIQSMWLAAGLEGLVGVFMGDVLIAEQTIRDRLGVTGDLVGVLALGRSDDPPVPKAVIGTVVRHG